MTIHVDARADTQDVFQGSKFHHGAPFRRAVEEGLIDLKATIQIGIGGSQDNTDGWDYSEQSVKRVAYCEELHEKGPEQITTKA